MVWLKPQQSENTCVGCGFSNVQCLIAIIKLSPPFHFLSLSLSLPTDAKLDAAELLLHSFDSAATVLNPQATRCACLYSLDFDPSGTVIGAAVRVSNYAELTTHLLPYKRCLELVP